LLAFALWAPLSLATLPGAALLATTPGAARPTRVMAAALGVVSAALLLAPGGGRLDAVTRAFAVLLTAAFVAPAWLSTANPPAAFLRLALRAILIAGAATAGLVQLAWGSGAWGALGWEARRNIGLTMRVFVELRPAVIVLYEPIVRFVSLATPFTLALKALAGLALAWRWQRWLTTAALPDAPGSVAIHEELVTTTT
jgi:hypothetical protein